MSFVLAAMLAPPLITCLFLIFAPEKSVGTALGRWWAGMEKAFWHSYYDEKRKIAEKAIFDGEDD